MKSIDIKGTARTEFGKKGAKQLRSKNLIPCILYGVDKDENGLPIAKHFSVQPEEVRNLVYSPDIHTVNLTIDGKTVMAIMKDIQFHAVSDNILHIDFYQITENKPIVMNVPIKLVGLAAGVKAGGKLEQAIRRIKCKAVYNLIPEKVEIDVTSLSIGKVIKVGDISLEGIELVNPKNTVVCGVTTTRAAAANASSEESGK
jgi:large subunit ribosomal protein L25